jgi:hypothetical protein
MADFSTPFGENSERRLPSADEKSLGFPCGPADQKLFNGLFHQLQKELDAIHSEAGVSGDNTEFNTTLLAIQELINNAISVLDPPEEPDLSPFLTLLQARARLPVFPEFLTADGKINVSSPATGTVRLPGGITFLHRGIQPIETVQTDFTTLASKTYHLRWSYSGGYALKDLADVAYNPSSLAESDTSFDSTYDDMLISRVVTNSSNVATITNLANKDRLTASYVKATTEAGVGTWSGLPILTGSPNWARTPRVISPTSYNVETTINEEAVVQIGTSRSRYTVTAHCWGYVLGQTNTYPSYTSGSISIDVMA